MYKKNQEGSTMIQAIKKNALFAVSLAVFVGLRTAYRLHCPEIADVYGYFERAMIRTKEQSISLTDSGLAYAYTGALSGLFRFVGNRIEAVWLYQMILQTAAVCLLTVGCYLLFGKVAAHVCAVLSALFPYLIQSLSCVSLENYFLFFYALLFFMISMLFYITEKSGWYRNSLSTLFLIGIGFMAGVLCIWHGFALSILAIMVFAVLANKENMAEQIKMQQNVQEMMTSISRLWVLWIGVFLGGFCTLMKYTGVTGNYWKEQLWWWLQHLTVEKDGLWQEMNPWICFYLGGAILMSGMFGFLAKKKKQQSEEMTEPAKPDEDIAKQEKDQATEELPKVTYLENPLPVPKKHEKRTMDFDVEDQVDDFDIQIDEKDDFDV